ncbi:hypothetical protein, partial [Bacillus haynesii]
YGKKIMENNAVQTIQTYFK